MLAVSTWMLDDLPEYERVSGVSGNLSSVGSDTLANLMTLWTEAFEKEYPNVKIQVSRCWFIDSTTSANGRRSQLRSNEPQNEGQRD